ncbi:hypothetical protein P3T76_012918 [Phytophthora citrophthora]|uniref:Uncharacterized protein n=1 Tax=Phytophthora citrophthora TaxID=4793 RepID=A0AAD9G3R3_9STRA|nr:hypothetical protein P3T76_012918 [Phytophthora citrophthora]
MHGKRVLKHSLSYGRTEVAYEDPEDMLSGLGWLEDRRLLVVSMNKRQVLIHDEKSSSTEVYADVKDMVVAQSGRAYIGSFGFDFAM